MASLFRFLESLFGDKNFLARREVNWLDREIFLEAQIHKLIEIPRIRQDFKCMVNNERSLALNVGGFKIDV